MKVACLNLLGLEYFERAVIKNPQEMKKQVDRLSRFKFKNNEYDEDDEDDD